MWDEITYPFPNFNGSTIEVWKWISNSISHFIVDVNRLSMVGLKSKSLRGINSKGDMIPVAHSALYLLIEKVPEYFSGLVQNCSNPSALAMEFLQSSTKPLILLYTCMLDFFISLPLQFVSMNEIIPNFIFVEKQSCWPQHITEYCLYVITYFGNLTSQFPVPIFPYQSIVFRVNTPHANHLWDTDGYWLLLIWAWDH